MSVTSLGATGWREGWSITCRPPTLSGNNRYSVTLTIKPKKIAFLSVTPSVTCNDPSVTSGTGLVEPVPPAGRGSPQREWPGIYIRDVDSQTTTRVNTV